MVSMRLGLLTVTEAAREGRGMMSWTLRSHQAGGAPYARRCYSTYRSLEQLKTLEI